MMLTRVITEWLLLPGGVPTAKWGLLTQRLLTCHSDSCVFLQIWSNLMVGEQLCFSHPRVFLSVSFVNLHTQAKVSFPIWNGCPRAFKASFNIFLLCMVLPSNLPFSQCLVWPRILYRRNTNRTGTALREGGHCFALIPLMWRHYV